ncbi:MAG TPA: glycosyltransferase [Miltoncostaea sp.]|nr:glycosyltransferase [Miltoncostaea sp.]
MTVTPASGHPAPQRILILSATVGAGHESAARALRRDLADESPGAEVVVADAIAAFGPLLRFFVRDLYRFLLRRAPWGYGAAYAVLTRVTVARALGLLGLRMLGARRLRRLVARSRADVVVSTFPGVTAILGHERLRGRIRAPVVATVTDVAGMVHWAHRGIDLHLVLHDRCAREIEDIAGPGAARRVAPLVDEAFLHPPDRAAARAALDVPGDVTFVVVSGGGWGVGDVEGATAAALDMPATVVAAVAGRNAGLRARLEERWRGDPRVRVLGFTRRMPALLAAADAIVHTTGGMTCMEALVTGCPLVVFGEPPGHARLNDQVLREEGLALGATDGAGLARALATAVADPRPGLRADAAPRAARLVVAARPRVRPLPVWRRRLAPVATGMAAATVLGFTATSAVAFRVLSRPLHVAPLTRVTTGLPEVGLIVRAPAAAVPAIAGALAGTSAHASFAAPAGPDGTAGTAAVPAGDEELPSVANGGVDWLEARSELRGEADAMRLAGPLRYLAPARLTLGEALTLRLAGGTPVAGALDLRAPLPAGPGAIRRGDIVVLSVGGAPAGVRTVRQVVGQLASAGLTATSLSSLLAGSRTSASARDDSSAIAPATTTASDAASTAPWAPPGQRSPNSAGASATGTRVPVANTIPATGAARRRCSALFSLRTPTAAATTTATSHSPARVRRPASRASADSFVARALHAKAAPALHAARAPVARIRELAYGASAAAASTPSASAIGQGPASDPLRPGAVHATPATPAMIATIAAASRRETGSPSDRAPIRANGTSPIPSAGCTTVSGASTRAAAWSGHPRTPSALARSHRGRRTRRSSSAGRNPRSGGAVRASAAWSRTSSAYSVEAPAASRTPSARELIRGRG